MFIYRNFASVPDDESTNVQPATSARNFRSHSASRDVHVQTLKNCALKTKIVKCQFSNTTVKGYYANATGTITKTRSYRRNKIVRRLIMRTSDLSYNERGHCIVKRTTVCKCTERTHTLRVTTIRTAIIASDVLRTYALIERYVKSEVFQKYSRRKSVEKVPDYIESQ